MIENAAEHALLAGCDHVVRPEDHGERHAGSRKVVLVVGFPQEILAQQFVHAVFVLAVTAVVGMCLSDRQHTGRGVGDRRRGEDVMAQVTGEQLNHEFNVLGVVGGDVTDHVPFGSGKNSPHSFGLAAVSDETAHRIRYLGLTAPTVQHGHLMALAHKLVYQRQTVEVCPTHDQNFHARQRRHPVDMHSISELRDPRIWRVRVSEPK